MLAMTLVHDKNGMPDIRIHGNVVMPEDTVD